MSEVKNLPQKSIKIIYLIYIVFMLAGTVLGKTISPGELSVEQEIENRFQQRISVLTGSEKVFVDVDVIISKTDTDTPDSSFRQQNKLKSLPGFSRPAINESHLKEKERSPKPALWEISAITVELVVDESMSDIMVGKAEDIIRNSSVFQAVDIAELSTKKIGFANIKTEPLTIELESLVAKLDRSIVHQIKMDSLRIAQESTEIEPKTKRDWVFISIISILASIILFGTIMLVRAINKIAGKKLEEPQISLNIPTQQKAEDYSEKQINVKIDQPIELYRTKEDESEQILNKAYKPFAFMKNISDKHLIAISSVLNIEELEVLISFISPKRAATVLSGMTDSDLTDISLRLSKIKKWKRDSIEKVREKVIAELNNLLRPNEISTIGAVSFSDMLTGNPEESDLPVRVLNLLEEKGNTELRQHIILFEDIPTYDKDVLKKSFQIVNRNDIVTALWNKDSSIVDKIFALFDKAMAENLRRQIRLLEDISPAEVSIAERNIVSAVKQVLGASINDKSKN